VVSDIQDVMVILLDPGSAVSCVRDRDVTAVARPALEAVLLPVWR
jgi:hypothetical protein